MPLGDNRVRIRVKAISVGVSHKCIYFGPMQGQSGVKYFAFVTHIRSERGENGKLLPSFCPSDSVWFVPNTGEE